MSHLYLSFLTYAEGRSPSHYQQSNQHILSIKKLSFGTILSLLDNRKCPLVATASFFLRLTKTHLRQPLESSVETAGSKSTNPSRTFGETSISWFPVIISPGKSSASRLCAAPIAAGRSPVLMNRPTSTSTGCFD